jgi:hypothetical protein
VGREDPGDLLDDRPDVNDVVMAGAGAVKEPVSVEAGVLGVFGDACSVRRLILRRC